MIHPLTVTPFQCYIKPLVNLSFGATYKSEVNLEFEGEADIDAPSQLTSILPRGDIRANLDLPANLFLGAAYSPIESVNITAELQYIWWSSYDKMEVDFLENEDWNTSSLRDYQDTYILRGGVEWWAMDEFALRAWTIL